MSAEHSLKHGRRLFAALVLLSFAAACAWWFLEYRSSWPRGEALAFALQPLIDEKSSDRSLVALAILDNYREARQNASRWSGLYWGFSWAAAALSALAALILKLESFLKNDGIKKDIAALLSVSAAILVTISTGGDFQRKWQANRIAAADLEQTGYRLLETSGVDARNHLASVGSILHARHMAIVGSQEQGKRPAHPHVAASSPR